MGNHELTKEIERLMKEIANNIKKLELTRGLEIERMGHDIDLGDIADEILRLTKQPWHNFFLAFWGAEDWKYQHLSSKDSWLDVLSDVSQIGRSTLDNIAKGIWVTNFKILKTEKGISEFLREDMILREGLNSPKQNVGFWFNEFYPESNFIDILKDVDTSLANFTDAFEERFVQAYMSAKHKIDWGSIPSNYRTNRNRKQKLKEDFRRNFVFSLRSYLLNLPFNEISEFYEEE